MIELHAASSGGGTSPGFYVLGAVIALVGVLAGAWWKRNTAARQLAFEKHKFSADQRKEAKADIEKALEAMGTVMLEDADLEARKEEAVNARIALQAVAVTHLHLVEDREFKQLQIALRSPSPETLTTAVRLWPNVERTILTKWPEFPK